MATERIEHIFLKDGRQNFRTAEIEHEYKTAIADLLHENSFRLNKNSEKYGNSGPYDLNLNIAENRLIIEIKRLGNKKAAPERVSLPISPFRRVVKDYFFICESYYKAASQMYLAQVETIDMAKRGLHNEGSEMLQDLLKPDIEVDFPTARRLFTLVCILHVR